MSVTPRSVPRYAASGVRHIEHIELALCAGMEGRNQFRVRDGGNRPQEGVAIHGQVAIAFRADDGGIGLLGHDAVDGGFHQAHILHFLGREQGGEQFRHALGRIHQVFANEDVERPRAAREALL